ncbi:PREDICTED: protein SPEAR3 isoform X2 [Tarenaya hassleriana]|uniref:protein SPEAR3 isoform X2 n=1 Tax=Tarenaya hassleriana TaxID=28532 RepID=UPI00053C8C9A|nr:PREDICTED: protein SPEAR3 isoform X2 [Tarenaya hassleriana]
MGSSFYGRPNVGGSSSSSSSSGTRKGKKNGSDKPKQPQRGLGVAQLEKIRLHGEMSCNSFNSFPSFHQSPYPSSFNQEDGRMQGGYSSVPPSSSSSPSFSYASSSPSTAYGFHPSMMMGLSEYERASVRYGDSQPHTAPSWNHDYGVLESQHFAQSSISRHFLFETGS